MGEVLVLTDNLRLHRFPLIQRRLWTNNRRRLVKPMKKGIHEAKTRSRSTTYRFHCAYRLHHWPSFLLGLCTFGTGEEWTEEARFFLLSLDVEILVVVDLSWKELATLWVRSGWRGFVCVQSFLDDWHGLVSRNRLVHTPPDTIPAYFMSVEEVRVCRIDIARLHTGDMC